MRPGDDMMRSSSVVQRVARQALATFRCAGGGGEAARGFPEQQSKLRALLSEVRAADLRLAEPRGAGDRDHRDHRDHHHPYPGGPPPVTYMHICETDEFSMGVFLLKRGASIPLHDHPGMYGMLKVLYGTARITCFDRLDAAAAPPPPPGTTTPPAAAGSPLRRSVLRSTGEYTELSGPCVLAPQRDNLHRIDAVDGPAAFLDILAPPYDPDDGRDCHYYQVVVPVPVPVPVPGGEAQGSEVVWLMDISQPHDFWCGSEPYPGPGVGL